MIGASPLDSRRTTGGHDAFSGAVGATRSDRAGVRDARREPRPWNGPCMMRFTGGRRRCFARRGQTDALCGTGPNCSRPAMSSKLLVAANADVNHHVDKQGRSKMCLRRDNASRVAPPVNFERIANDCSQMMERHRSGVDLIQMGRIWEALSLLEEVLDPRTSM
jgi:hypothetical protein